MGGFTPRQSLNAGTALVARGEFTVILAQVAATNPAISTSEERDLVAIAGMYVLITAVIGVAAHEGVETHRAQALPCAT